MSNEVESTGRSAIVIRTTAWDDEIQQRMVDEDKRRRMEEAIQSRPRFHNREMGNEERYQRKVERYREERAATYDWLLKRVADGRVELLKRSRLGGIEKEVRSLWVKKGMTMSSRQLIQHEM
jgi:hypothetical protein